MSKRLVKEIFHLICQRLTNVLTTHPEKDIHVRYKSDQGITGISQIHLLGTMNMYRYSFMAIHQIVAEIFQSEQKCWIS